MKKNLFILFAMLFFLTSCEGVFVWTIKDMIGLVFLGLVALVILIIGLIALFNKIKGWWNN